MHSKHDRTPGPRRIGRSALDIEDGERDVAAWFAWLERAPAPRGLRALLATAPHAAARAAWTGRFPLGAWGLASAALLLLALGVGTTIELAMPPSPRPGTAAASTDAMTRVVIVEDPTMALFHDVETFDEVGLAPGELIADWGR
jgi:hypothetical protein